MQIDEVEALIKRKEEDYINGWNQTRYIVYSVIQSQSTKSLSPTDVLEFPWEKIDTPSVNTKSKEELLQHALDMEKIINKNG